MATIDDIRIKLGVEAADVQTGVNSLNKALDGLRKERTAQIKLSVTQPRSFTQDLGQLKSQIAALGTIPIRADPKFDTSAIQKKLDDGPPLEMAVKLDTNLTKAEAKKT